MNWFQSLGSKRTQAFLAIALPAALQIIQAIIQRQPIPLEYVWVVLGSAGIWQVSDSIRPTVKPAEAADFAELQKLLEDLQAKLRKPDEVAK